MDIPISTSMQAKPDQEVAAPVFKIIAKILCDLEGEIERLQTPYMIQLLWVNYLEVLKHKALNVVVDHGDMDTSQAQKWWKAGSNSSIKQGCKCIDY